MINSEVFDLMMKRLGNRTAPTLRAVCVQELNAKIQELEVGPYKPWFLESLATGNLVANQDYVTVPDDFLMEVEEGRMRVQNSEGCWKKIGKGTMEQLEDCFLNDTAAFPKGYALYGDRFYFGPGPAAAYAYRVQYFKKTTAVVDNNAAISNKWLVEFLNYTTLAALDVVARLHVQSDEVTRRIADDLKIAFDGFWRAVEARKHMNMDYLLDNVEN